MFLAEKRDGAFFACALMLATHFKMGKWDEQHGKSQRSLDPVLIRTLNLLHSQWFWSRTLTTRPRRPKTVALSN